MDQVINENDASAVLAAIDRAVSGDFGPRAALGPDASPWAKELFASLEKLLEQQQNLVARAIGAEVRQRGGSSLAKVAADANNARSRPGLALEVLDPRC